MEGFVITSVETKLKLIGGHTVRHCYTGRSRSSYKFYEEGVRSSRLRTACTFGNEATGRDVRGVRVYIYTSRAGSFVSADRLANCRNKGAAGSRRGCL